VWCFAALALFGLILATGWWLMSAKRPALVRERLAARLHELSPRWRGLDWKSCAPDKGEYRLQAFYTAEAKTYTVVLNRSVATDYSSIRVNPQEGTWLAQALFYQSELDSFDYRGSSAAEKEELRALCCELDGALTAASRD
jgi:hypothetical protein